MHGQRPATFNELEALGDRLSRQIKSVRIKAARGVSVYTDLLGTPSTFAESAGKVAKVNSDEDSIEFGYISHTELTDVGAHDHPIEVIGTPTYDDFQDWLNIIQSAGRISGGEITENAAHNGTIDVAAGTGFIKTSDSPTGLTKSFDWDADTGIALTDNRINYVYMDYNGGAPVIGVTIDRTTLDGRTEFILGKVYREGTTLHILSYGIRLTELAYNEHERLISVRGFERASGGEISETGQRYLTSGAGVFYFGLNKIETSAQDTSGADRFTYWYRDGGGGWTKVTGQQQIDNIHYDDGSGALATLTANRYGVHWVYIHYDSDINVVYGQGNYKLAEAENAVLPDTVPELVSDFGVLAAKIVVQKSGANLLTVKSAYKELFPTTFPPKLGDLTDVNAETPNDNDVLSWDAGTSRWIAVTGGVSGFIGLSDTPANYAGSAGYFLRVNATPDAVEFRSPAQVLSDLSGQAGAAFSWNDQDLEDVPNLSNKTTAAWSKTIGSGGDYATWAAMIADMPDLIAHAVTVTIKKGTILTETCELMNKNGLTSDAQITIKAEEYFPQSGALPTASSATATTLVDSSQSWAIDRFIDCWVLIVDGTGTDNGFVKITDSDATSITVASWPGTQPDNTSRYLIVGALIDCGGTRNQAFELSNNVATVKFYGIGVNDADYYGIIVEYCINTEMYYCGVYGSDRSGIRLSRCISADFRYNGFVGNNTDNAAGQGGINSDNSYVILHYNGFSDNNRQGIYIANLGFGYINNNFGDGNGLWGSYAENSGQAIILGAECSGSSGNHSDAGTADTAGDDQAAIFT